MEIDNITRRDFFKTVGALGIVTSVVVGSTLTDCDVEGLKHLSYHDINYEENLNFYVVTSEFEEEPFITKID